MDYNLTIFVEMVENFRNDIFKEDNLLDPVVRI